MSKITVPTDDACRAEWKRYSEACCEDCGLHYQEFGIDTTLSNEEWLIIHPEGGEGLLCAKCIVERASLLPNIIVARMDLVFACDVNSISWPNPSPELKENMTSILKITKEQLLEKGASAECKAFRKFIKKFGDAVEFEWTLEKQLELLRHRIWRRRFGWLVHVGLLSMWSMVEVDLSKVDLSKADMRGANLGGANLYKANLYKADLFRADLSGAYLKWANLGGANLNGANLSDADLTGANLDGVIHDEYTVWPDGIKLVD